MSTLISRLYNWVTDKGNGVKITASRVDGELDQIITALNRKVLCSSSAPNSPIAGQTWFDTTNKLLKAYRNNEWVIQGIVHVGTSAPSTVQEGDVWYDTTNDILKVYNGATWLSISTSPGGVLGSFKNLSVSRSSATAVAVTADELVLEDTNNNKVVIRAVTETITITTSGASGLVAALSEAADTIYYIWIARKSSDGTVNGFLSTSAVFATVLAQLDSGYDQLALVSCVGNDHSSNLIPFTQKGCKYRFTTMAVIASGNAGTGSWNSIDLTPANMDTNPGFVPSALSDHCFGVLAIINSTARMTNNSSVGSVTDGTVSQRIGADWAVSAGEMYWEFEVQTADTLYWISSAAGNKVYLHGFDINKLA